MTSYVPDIDPSTDIHAYLAQHERKEMLRFLTCGSVDDGKSTLIGRLLYDSKMVYEDQLAAVQVDSKRFGTTGDDFDPALLTDGLRAEREQGITIDVAYRYFSTSKRKFIIADTPGHEQYTRNMATGASTCDLAIILIDARHGVLTQTRRHSFIASLLGIKHIVVAVNKMDLADWAEPRYEEIKAEYADFAAKLDLGDIRFVPMAALTGDNVVNPSDNMPWYTGGTLMHHLENVVISADRNLIDFRMPVQYVNRPNLDFRGFCGTLASGTVRPGDEIIVLPSRKTTKVKSIVTMDGELDEAFPPQSVTITTTEEVDISRGDMLAHPGNQPRVDTRFEAMVVWMNEAGLVPGKQYDLKANTRLTTAIVESVRYRMDVNELHREDASGLELNEIGRVAIETARPLAFDPYERNRGTGAFILIDRLTNNTVGAGMILDRAAGEGRSARKTVEIEAGGSMVPATERAQRLSQKPVTLWITGLTGSGKSAIAFALERRLYDEGKVAHVLDGGNARLGLSSDLDFSADDRSENLRRAAEVARLFNQAGLISICSFLSPAAADRQTARDIVTGGSTGSPFIEVFCDAPADVAAQRSPDADSIRPFADEQAPYEPPTEAELTLPTAELNINESVERILDLLKQREII
ncbi:MAG: sulfate adenylyltransferase subunit CysN [Planctomycetota bacterium]